MSKYNVGDKVRIRSDLERSKVYNMIPSDGFLGYCVTKEMYEMRGKVVTITENLGCGYGVTGFSRAWFTDEMFEGLVEDKKVFTKNDLQNGDVIKKRNGSVEIVVLPLGTLVTNDNISGFNELSDIREDLTSKLGDNYDIIAVRRPTNVNHCRFAAFEHKNGDLVYDRERDTKPLYNGKVVCIDDGLVPESLTVGKIYEFVNGNGICDTGENITKSPVTDFNDLVRRFTTVKFIEIKE